MTIHSWSLLKGVTAGGARASVLEREDGLGYRLLTTVPDEPARINDFDTRSAALHAFDDATRSLIHRRTAP